MPPIAFAMSPPDDVDINEMLYRPTGRSFDAPNFRVLSISRRQFSS